MKPLLGTHLGKFKGNNDWRVERDRGIGDTPGDLGLPPKRTQIFWGQRGTEREKEEEGQSLRWEEGKPREAKGRIGEGEREGQEIQLTCLLGSFHPTGSQVPVCTHSPAPPAR
jgi:hypothetical protein